MKLQDEKDSQDLLNLLNDEGFLNVFNRERYEEVDDSIEMEDPIASMEYADLDPSPDTALRMVEVVSVVSRPSMPT